MARAPIGAILQYLRKLTASPADGETDRHLVRRYSDGCRVNIVPTLPHIVTRLHRHPIVIAAAREGRRR
jgi:hypothetical protein